MSRECGECVACCVYLRIPELAKGGLEPCASIVSRVSTYTGGGCKIYDDGRPVCCVEYECAWKRGHGEAGDRPDRSMMLFDRTKQIDNCLEAKPLEPGAESTPAGLDLIARMSRSVGMPAVVLDFKERRVVRVHGVPE